MFTNVTLVCSASVLPGKHHPFTGPVTHPSSYPGPSGDLDLRVQLQRRVQLYIRMHQNMRVGRLCVIHIRRRHTLHLHLTSLPPALSLRRRRAPSRLSGTCPTAPSYLPPAPITPTRLSTSDVGNHRLYRYPPSRSLHR